MDTGICPEGLRCESFASYKICKDESDPGEMSHGTLCARVLDSLADAYELVSIQILPNQSRGESKSLGLIEHFREGLKLCLELKADLVCMSAVSSVPTLCICMILQRGWPDKAYCWRRWTTGGF